MGERENSRVSMLVAFLASLVVHVAGLALAQTVRESQPMRLTRALPDPLREPEELDKEPPDPEEINPGIERGVEATMTWIGYEEYREHLARLAKIDQAAFTSSQARGVVDGAKTAIDQFEMPTDDSARPADADAEAAVQPDAAELNNAPADASDLPMQAAVETSAVDADASEEPADGPEIEFTDSPAPAETAHADDDGQPPPPDSARDRIEGLMEIVEQMLARREQIVTTDMPPIPEETAESESSIRQRPPEGEPSDRDAVKSEKDAEATSIVDVPEKDWNSGQPLALQGLEVQPYNLYRHIVVDSADRLFRHDLARVVQRNPVVSLRFTRFGRAGEVRILRDSGYEPFDRQYLRTWLARWTAKGGNLAGLSAEELTPPIVIKLVFIPETEPQKSADRK